MKILFDIGHPAHVHMFRHSISLLKEKGHNVIVTVKDIPSAIDLLNRFDIEYELLGRKYDSIILKGISQLIYDWNLFLIAKRNKIDIAIGSSITITHVSRIHKMKSIIMDDDDDEMVKLFVRFAHPFADCILSPHALGFQRNGKKDITYNGTHEVMYLHPKRFHPNPSIIEELGLNKNDNYFILRFVAVKAYHDIGQAGLTLEQKQQIINRLLPHGKVFITTERKIEPELEKYQLKVSSENIHHVLYYAKMFIGDSQTMTTEAAILGTPSLKCNTFAGKLSVPNSLENKYGLCFSFQPKDFKQLFSKIDSFLQNQNIEDEWREKKEVFFNEIIDVTSFLVWLIENYPQSIKTMQENPDYQFNFK